MTNGKSITFQTTYDARIINRAVEWIKGIPSERLAASCPRQYPDNTTVIRIDFVLYSWVIWYEVSGSI